MARNGSGTYSLPQAPFTPNTTISSAAVNSDLSDIAAALTQSVSADGQTTLTGTLLGFAGTATTPAYAFSGAPQTGFYPAAGGAIGGAFGGTQVFQSNGTGVQGRTLGVVPGLGYGGTVTQTGSITTLVTLNAASGVITTVSNSWTALTPVSFTFGNTFIGTNDVIVFSANHTATGAYSIFASAVQANGCSIGIVPFNTITEVLGINFIVLKVATT